MILPRTAEGFRAGTVASCGTLEGRGGWGRHVGQADGAFALLVVGSRCIDAMAGGRR